MTQELGRATPAEEGGGDSNWLRLEKVKVKGSESVNPNRKDLLTIQHQNLMIREFQDGG
jgi:hypothetical protein